MKTNKQSKRSLLTLILTSLVLVVLGFVSTQHSQTKTTDAGSVKGPKKEEKPEVKGNPLRNAYFGDLHVHTGWSNDVYMVGGRSTPDDAYRYAKGEGIRHPAGYLIKLKRPLDFMGVTEHAEYMGVINQLYDPKSPLYNHPLAKGLRAKTRNERFAATIKIFDTIFKAKPVPEFVDPKITKKVWKEIIALANDHNDPGKFTAFIAIEWSSNGPDGVQNLHRNVIFRGSKATEATFSVFDSRRPEDLWDFMDKTRKSGFEVLAIPHNPNLSDGLMFQRVDSDGKPIDRSYAEKRIRNEPAVEVTQIKGTSETHPALSPNDEFANFEINDYAMEIKNIGQRRSKPKGSYVRDAYRVGLVLAEKLGVNPYKFGVIGSTDTHNAGSPVEEDNYFGKLALEDGTPHERLQGKGLWSKITKLWSAAGLTGAWAESNTREALFDAIKRKETFATTGSRIKVRLFGGWNFYGGEHRRPDFVKIGYERGVPMGGDLKARPKNAGAPSFLVWASRDAKGANLDRIQIIKGWAKNGQTFEKIYNVTWSGARMQDRKTGRIPPVGNTVNVTKATYTNTIGAERLSVVWRDPDFDSSQRAFYYARVLEIPTPRWSTYDAKKLRISPLNPASIQERAFTSPIWYTPSKMEFAKGRSTAMTIEGLKKQGAQQLSTVEINELLVGKNATTKNLVTGVEYNATYGKDGVRTLSAAPGFSSSHIGAQVRNAYQIKDGMLHSSLPDGTRFASRIYRRGTRYYANKDDELDYVNYELMFR